MKWLLLVAASDQQITSIILPLIVCAAVVLFLIVFTMPVKVARERNHPSADAIFVCQWIGLIIWPAWFAALIWAYTTPTKSGEGEHVRGAFPVASDPAIGGDGPGRYRINGVVRATGTDIKTYIQAESRANALVKAELKGIVVTEMVKEA